MNVEWNWAHTHRFEGEMTRPDAVDQAQAIVARAAAAGRNVRPVGSRHSFTSIGDGDVVVDTTGLPERFELAPDRLSVIVGGSMIYSRVAELLLPENLALHNLASLPHISVAGAIATATHGSGDANANLAAAVKSLEIITSTGEIRRTTRGDGDFAALTVSMGAAGIVVGVELEVEPTFQIEQLVHDDLSWSCVQDNFDAIVGSAYSVSLFTNWNDHLQLWTKRRVASAGIEDTPIEHGSLHDGVLAPAQRHPIPAEAPEPCTHQGPAPGRWDERLPHFRAGAVPSVGAEAQSEFFVDRASAVAALQAMRGIGADLAPHLMAAEIRTIAADDLWLSPQFERDSVGLHFTWHHDVAAARHAAGLVAAALAPLNPRPHWAKVFDAAQFDFAALYPRLADATSVLADWDPTSTFKNRWWHETFA